MAPHEEKKDEERVVWENMKPLAWHNSIAEAGSIFSETYNLTRDQIELAVVQGNHDVIIEVGCGTGDIIGELKTSIPHYGLDINEEFIDFCRQAHDHTVFLVEDALNLSQWWKQFAGKYKRPLVTCVNNTLNIMPAEIRGQTISEMLQVAGPEGKVLVTYWNGEFFSHAIKNYYKKNEDLCGSFDVNQDVDWESRCLVTPTNYSTEWLYVPEVQKLLRAYDVNVPDVLEKPDFSKNHINASGLSIFVWFNQECTSRAKTYYDSNDAQRFYSNIWGEETVHIGRHDLLTAEEKASLSKQEQISRAQVLHEREFVSLIQSKFDTKIRIVDMGCGFGGLLRRIWEAKLASKATGCDISSKMCDQARRLNQQLGCSKDITILEESYLDITMADASADLVISMDALLHTGPEGQRQAVQEAARILRPGGWMIFSDIMQQEEVDQAEMQPIYDRIHLDKLGTVSNYKAAFEQAGFTNFAFEEHSSNVSTHYGTIREVLHEKANGIGLSEEYTEKMSAGLQVWKELAPKNIVWGFVCAQKKEE